MQLSMARSIALSRDIVFEYSLTKYIKFQQIFLFAEQQREYTIFVLAVRFCPAFSLFASFWHHKMDLLFFAYTLDGIQRLFFPKKCIF